MFAYPLFYIFTDCFRARNAYMAATATAVVISRITDAGSSFLFSPVLVPYGIGHPNGSNVTYLQREIIIFLAPHKIRKKKRYAHSAQSLATCCMPSSDYAACSIPYTRRLYLTDFGAKMGKPGSERPLICWRAICFELKIRRRVVCFCMPLCK